MREERTNLVQKRSKVKYFLYFNYQGLANEYRLHEFEKALEKINWDIVCLSETRREGNNLIMRKNGNLFYSYGTSKGHWGVGFLHQKPSEKAHKVNYGGFLKYIGKTQISIIPCIRSYKYRSLSRNRNNFIIK